MGMLIYPYRSTHKGRK